MAGLWDPAAGWIESNYKPLERGKVFQVSDTDSEPFKRWKRRVKRQSQFDFILIGTNNVPLLRKFGISKWPAIIIDFICSSSSSSNGRLPVSKAWRMIPKDQMSTSE
jgi:hypothetical protein